jgi:hypothetical protein
MPSEAAIALIACAFFLLAGIYAACLLRKIYAAAREETIRRRDM